jgi:hypothetical protein
MPTYQELRTTYAQLTPSELRDLARRPIDLTAQGQAALADELSLRDVGTENDLETTAAAPSWYKGWLTVFQAWVTLHIVAFAAGFILLRPGLGWPTLGMLAIVAIPCIGLVLIANQHSSARRFWPTFLAVWLVSEVTVAFVIGGFTWRDLIDIATIVAWYKYWLSSKRVAMEFGADSQKLIPSHGAVLRERSVESPVDLEEFRKQGHAVAAEVDRQRSEAERAQRLAIERAWGIRLMIIGIGAFILPVAGVQFLVLAPFGAGIPVAAVIIAAAGFVLLARSLNEPPPNADTGEGGDVEVSKQDGSATSRPAAD